MSMEKMRNEFEAWECDADQGPQTDPVWLMYDAKTNTYPLDKIQDRWKVWQASRASLVIDLRHEDEEKLCSFDYGAGYRAARNIAHQSIRAAGLKVAQ